jgi:DNA-directed RNA polymerase subunit RPC12/RpoP
MVEYACPDCGYENRINHSAIDWVCDLDTDVQCGKCHADILIDMYPTFDISNVRLKPADAF